MLEVLLWAIALLAAPLLVNAADSEIKSINLRTHSLHAPYLDTDMTNRWWDFGGDTIIRADQYVRLASDSPSMSGWLFSRIPLTATNWEVEFEFSIDGKGTLHGDGFAFWMTEDRAEPGNVFGHKDRFNGLGIFFDTYKNNRPGTVFPYVMGMLGDGNTAYDAPSDGKANEIGGCSARGIRGASVPTRAKITYFHEKSLEVALQYKSSDEWTECFKIDTGNFNRPIRIPNTSYLGFSAHTGELSDNFDIINIDTRNLYDPQGASSGKQTQPMSHSDFARPKRADRQGGGWGWFFFKLIIFGMLVGGGYVGWTRYKENQRNQRYKGF